MNKIKIAKLLGSTALCSLCIVAPICILSSCSSSGEIVIDTINYKDPVSNEDWNIIKNSVIQEQAATYNDDDLLSINSCKEDQGVWYDIAASCCKDEILFNMSYLGNNIFSIITKNNDNTTTELKFNIEDDVSYIAVGNVINIQIVVPGSSDSIIIPSYQFSLVIYSN